MNYPALLQRKFDDEFIKSAKAREHGIRVSGVVAGEKPQIVISTAGTVRRGAATGRNKPCPCGSGRKWKKCCGAPVDPAAILKPTVIKTGN